MTYWEPTHTPRRGLSQRRETEIQPVTPVALEDQLRTILQGDVDEQTRAAAARILEAVGVEYLEALLFYGSRKSKSNPESLSYIDFYVVLKDGTERPFYERLLNDQDPGAPRFWHQMRTTAACWAHPWLVPSMYDIVERDEDGRVTRAIKLCVISKELLERELTIFSRDHHHRARFAQPMKLLYPLTEDGLELAGRWQALAYRLTFEFIHVDLPLVFDLETYVTMFLRASYSSEVRPESDGKVKAIWENEKHILRPLYQAILDERLQSLDLRRLEANPNKFVVQKTIWNYTDRLGSRLFRIRTKLRTSARWFKSMLTFRSWIDYAVEKVYRSTGYRLYVNAFHRRLWFIFVFPKFAQFLIQKRRYLRRDAIARAQIPQPKMTRWIFSSKKDPSETP